MSAPQTTGISYRRAYGFSIALHLLVAASIAVAPVPYVGAGSGTGAGGAPETTRIATISITHRAARMAADPGTHPAERRSVRVAQARPKPQPRSHPHPVARVAAVAPANGAGAAVAASIARGRHASSLARLALTIATAPPERRDAPASAEPATPVARSAPAAVATTPPPTPLPTPSADSGKATDVARANAHGIDVPDGGWGQTFAKPLVADDDALAALRANYHVSATVTVDVDETGHATRIVFPATFNATTRADLEKSLLGMKYVPAECNGLRCAGSFQVAL